MLLPDGGERGIAVRADLYVITRCREHLSDDLAHIGFVVDEQICGQVPNLCHEIKTEQFAVARNTVGDVDGDGVPDGEFVVSRPVEVTVVLQCSTCESPSCQELLPELELFEVPPKA